MVIFNRTFHKHLHGATWIIHSVIRKEGPEKRKSTNCHRCLRSSEERGDKKRQHNCTKSKREEVCKNQWFVAVLEEIIHGAKCDDARGDGKLNEFQDKYKLTETSWYYKSEWADKKETVMKTIFYFNAKSKHKLAKKSKRLYVIAIDTSQQCMSMLH